MDTNIDIDTDDLEKMDAGEVAREAVRLLRALSRRVERVEENTRPLPQFVKWMGQIFSYGSQEFLKHVSQEHTRKK